MRIFDAFDRQRHRAPTFAADRSTSTRLGLPVIAVLAVVAFGWYLFHNTQNNLAHRGITSDSAFSTTPPASVFPSI